MSKTPVTRFICSLLLLFLWSQAGGGTIAAQNHESRNNQNANGTLQKMIVENGSVTLNLDLNGLNRSNSLVARPVTLRFAAAANSFFPILVFNNLLRGLEPGSMALAWQSSSSGGVNTPDYKNLFLRPLEAREKT